MARRRRGSPPAPALPRTREAIACVLLAIDPGATAGWALFVAGVLREVGIAKKATQRQAVVQAAIDLAATEGLSLIVVAEAWEAGGWKSHTAMIGTGAQWGRWQEQLEMVGHPVRRILRVTPQRWRSLVLKARTKDAAVAYCAARWEGFVFATADACEAACVGAWGTHAGEVAEVVPVRRARAPRGAGGGGP